MSERMRAVVSPAYGSAEVLRVEDMAKPVPRDGEVLVRVQAASVCRGDIHLLTGKPYLLRLGFGLRRPRYGIPGQNVSGTVEVVGPNASELRVGDEVFGQVSGGAFAEYLCARQDAFVRKPDGVSFEEAAAVPTSGMTALQALREAAGIKAGQSVLINGASGGVGSFAVQIAKALGADVTAVCSARNVERMTALGADHVIDYARDDFAQAGRRYDVMLDLVGNRTLADCKRAIGPKGVYVSCSGGGGDWLGPMVWLGKVMLGGIFGTQRLTTFIQKPRQADLLFLKDLVEAGQVRPLIDRRFSLAETAEAVRHVAGGHSQGTTVITVAPQPSTPSSPRQSQGL